MTYWSNWENPRKPRTSNKLEAKNVNEDVRPANIDTYLLRTSWLEKHSSRKRFISQEIIINLQKFEMLLLTNIDSYKIKFPAV
jgi:hypothetical protein